MSTPESPHSRTSAGRLAQDAPEGLLAAPFLVSTALDAGVERRVLRRRTFATPHRGVRSPQHAPTFEQRCAEALLVAPAGSALSHLTAARLFGVWLPTRAEATEGIHVVRPTSTSRLRRPGIVEHRGAQRRRIVRLRGLSVTGPGDTWADLSTHLGLFDLVAAGDCVAGAVGMAPLVDAVERRSRYGARGVVRLREALTLVRPGSASRMETVTRCHALAWGLTEPLLNVDVRDGQGNWLARVDFLWPRSRVVAEFQGRQFHVGDRRDADEVRRHVLEGAGYRVVFITAAMLGTAPRRDALFTHVRTLLHDDERSQHPGRSRDAWDVVTSREPQPGSSGPGVGGVSAGSP